MNRIKYIAAAVIVLCMAALYLISSTDLVLKEQETPIYNISVICNDVRDEYNVNFKKGVNQTFSEWTADVNYVTLYDRNDEVQQLELLEREIANGADAIILFPVENESMQELLQDRNITVPVVCVGAGVYGGRQSVCVHGDNKENGRLLAERIAEDMGTQKRAVYLLTDQEGRGDIKELIQGMNGEFALQEISYRLIRYETQEELADRMKEIYRADRKAVFVSLDASTQEAVLNGTSLVDNSACRFYTVGTTDRILDYVSKGRIQAAIVNNEFDMGYLSMRAAVGLLNGEKTEQDILVQSLLVTTDKVYERDCQKILFPME